MIYFFIDLVLDYSNRLAEVRSYILCAHLAHLIPVTHKLMLRYLSGSLTGAAVLITVWDNLFFWTKVDGKRFIFFIYILF